MSPRLSCLQLDEKQLSEPKRLRIDGCHEARGQWESLTAHREARFPFVVAAVARCDEGLFLSSLWQQRQGERQWCAEGEATAAAPMATGRAATPDGDADELHVLQAAARGRP